MVVRREELIWYTGYFILIQSDFWLSVYYLLQTNQSFSLGVLSDRHTIGFFFIIVFNLLSEMLIDKHIINSHLFYTSFYLSRGWICLYLLSEKWILLRLFNSHVRVTHSFFIIHIRGQKLVSFVKSCGSKRVHVFFTPFFLVS